MTEPKPTDPTHAPEPFFLIIADDDAGLFCPEGPMTDAAAWKLAAGRACENGRSVSCGPSGSDREALAKEFRRTSKMGGAPPGSIVRPRG